MKLTDRVREEVRKGIGRYGQLHKGICCVQEVTGRIVGTLPRDHRTIITRPLGVHKIDCSLVMRLNDAEWSSPKVRGEQMANIAALQLNTAGCEREDWLDYIRRGVDDIPGATFCLGVIDLEDEDDDVLIRVCRLVEEAYAKCP